MMIAIYYNVIQTLLFVGNNNKYYIYSV